MGSPAIVAEYKALVEPYQARGQKAAAEEGLAHLIAKYGADRARDALAGLVSHYEANGL